MTDPVAATSTTKVTPSMYTGWAVDGAQPTAEDQALGKDAFLKLLVAQLRYQDPSNPTDPSTFMNQTAQLSMVEKIESMVSSSNEATLAAQTQTAVSMVGKQVSWTDTDGKSVLAGPVSAVTLLSGVPKLRVGNFDLDLSQITAVAPAPAVTPPAGSSTGTTTT